MISFFRAVAVIVFVISSSLSQLAYAQEACVTSGDSLKQAKDNFASQCNVARVDCDPYDGIWYCASFSLNSSTPPALTAVPSSPQTPPTPQPSAPAPQPPAPETPAVAQPAPVTQPVVTVPVVEPPAPRPPAASRVRPACERADSDSDGDGFGWENGTTCLVTAPVAASQPAPAITRPVETQPVAAPPAPATTPTPAGRPSCTRTDSDSDGDGFGWENGTTCLATARSITVPQRSNTPVPVAPPVSSVVNNSSNNSVTASDITDLILVTGQSNALGSGTAYNPALDSPNNKVFAFTNNGWRVADLHQIWDRRWFPRTDPSTDPSNNFSLHFGKSIATRTSNRVIGFILVTAPGAAIAEWNIGSSFYNTIETKVLDAINQLPHKSAVDGILWHQGESDGQDRQYYTDALYALISNLRNEPWVKSQAPFICGETKIASINNRLNGLNRDSDPNTACVKGIDLSTLGDDRHFDAQALRTLGARYADAYLRITR